MVLVYPVNVRKKCSSCKKNVNEYRTFYELKKLKRALRKLLKTQAKNHDIMGKRIGMRGFPMIHKFKDDDSTGRKHNGSQGRLPTYRQRSDRKTGGK